MDVIETLEQAVERADDAGAYEGLENTEYVEEGAVTEPATCCDGTCPEVADVTINENTYQMGEIADVKVTLSPGAATPSDTRTVTVQLLDEDGADLALAAEIKLRLVESLTDLKTKSPFLPQAPSQTEWTSQTDANGEYEFTLEQAAEHQWYLVVIVGPFVYYQYQSAAFDVTTGL